MNSWFVLVDFENVQPKNIGLLHGGAFKIKVFVGANQAKVPLEIARALQAFGPHAEYIQIEGSGRNALDFHIAYYLGRLAAENPDASFCIVSKDSGFDPLIRHVTAQKVFCKRFESISDIHLSDTPGSAAPSDRVDAIIANLARRKAARPRTLKTLRSTIKAFVGDTLADEQLDGLIDKLAQRGIVSIVDGKVNYEQE